MGGVRMGEKKTTRTRGNTCYGGHFGRNKILSRRGGQHTLVDVIDAYGGYEDLRMMCGRFADDCLHDDEVERTELDAEFAAWESDASSIAHSFDIDCQEGEEPCGRDEGA